LRELGIDGQHSYEKIIPDDVFRLSNEQIALFLRHLWATDGSIYLRKTTHSKAGTIYYSSASIILALQIQHLLARLGIVSRVTKSQKKGYRLNYQVHISGKNEQLKFADIVSGYGDRKVALDKVKGFLLQLKANTNVDTIPIEIRDVVKVRMKDLGITQRKMAQLRGTVYGGDAHFGFSPSRAVLGDYAALLDEPGLKEISQADVFWDTIVSIEECGEQDVYDMTVPGTHNFVANGILVHNSLEQDADIVMFIHRPELFDRDTDKPNIAQIKVGKHRNGPVGTVELVFRSNLAKFENAATRNIDLSKVT
jgi:replicative DNA helicase